jgi:hypothetical protein
MQQQQQQQQQQHVFEEAVQMLGVTVLLQRADVLVLSYLSVASVSTTTRGETGRCPLRLITPGYSETRDPRHFSAAAATL